MREKSCGAVLYTRNSEGRLIYLLVETKSGHISFAKGHMEQGETELETARREILEETGFRIDRFEPGFREAFHYIARKGNEKEVIYFLADFKNQTPVIQASEIPNHWMLGYDEARALINRAREQEILTLANDLLCAK